MAYARKYRKRKLTANNVYRRPTNAKSQQKQIATLARRTNRLSQTIKEVHIYGQFTTQLTNLILNGAYVIRPFHPRQGARSAVFNDQLAIQKAKGFKFTKYNMDMLIQPYTEPQHIDMTVFIVSLQPAVAKKVHNETNNMTTLTAGVDFHTVANSLTLVNQGRFKIHAVKRIQTFKSYTDNTPQTRGFHRLYFKRRCTNKVINESGTWVEVDDVEYPLLGRQYVIVFHNNSTMDAQHPSLSFNCLWSGHTCSR